MRVASADLEHESLDDAVRDATGESVDCLYVFTPGSRLPDMMELTRRGARLVTLRQTLTRGSSTDSTACGPSRDTADVRLARRGDARVLRKLAEELAPFSRFASDSRFDRVRISAMYRVWADQCLSDGVVTVAQDGTGFVGVTLSPGEATSPSCTSTEQAPGVGWVERFCTLRSALPTDRPSWPRNSATSPL